MIYISKKKIIFILVDAARIKLPDSIPINEIYPYVSLTKENGAFFANAFTHINATDPSLATIYSGLPPKINGIINHGTRVSETEVNQYLKLKDVLLTNILSRNGYNTIAFDWFSRWHRIGYNEYDEGKRVSRANRLYLKGIKPFYNLFDKKYIIEKKYYINAKELLALVYRKIKLPEKQFIFVHLWDCHIPYTKHSKDYDLKYFNSTSLDELHRKYPSSMFINDYLLSYYPKNMTIDEIINHYYSSLHSMNIEINRFLEKLSKNFNLDDFIIIICSDHGESTHEHEIFFDHHGLYDETVRVPLFYINPSCEDKGILSQFVQLSDLYPTILDETENNSKSNIAMSNNIFSRETQDRKYIVVEEHNTQQRTAVITRKYKYIFAENGEYLKCRYCGYIHEDGKGLFNLKKDPGEMDNCIETSPQIETEMSTYYDEYLEKIKEIRTTNEMKSISKTLRRIA